MTDIPQTPDTAEPNGDILTAKPMPTAPKRYRPVRTVQVFAQLNAARHAELVAMAAQQVAEEALTEPPVSFVCTAHDAELQKIHEELAS